MEEATAMTKDDKTQDVKNAMGVKHPFAIGKVTITKGDPATDFWLQGHLTRSPDYTFDAKVFDIGSEFGIKNGRISKLEVRHQGRTVMNYERGWEEKPKSWKDKAALKDILASFPDPGLKQDGLAAKLQQRFRLGRKGY